MVTRTPPALTAEHTTQCVRRYTSNLIKIYYSNQNNVKERYKNAQKNIKTRNSSQYVLDV